VKKTIARTLSCVILLGAAASCSSKSQPTGPVIPAACQTGTAPDGTPNSTEYTNGQAAGTAANATISTTAQTNATADVATLTVKQLQTNGYNDGYAEGYSDGYNKGGNASAGGYPAGYNAGYLVGEQVTGNEGCAQGQTDGYNTGYNDGVAQGETDGYNTGYSDGYNDGLNSITCGSSGSSGTGAAVRAQAKAQSTSSSSTTLTCYQQGYDNTFNQTLYNNTYDSDYVTAEQNLTGPNAGVYNTADTNGYNAGFPVGQTDGFNDGYAVGVSDGEAFIFGAAYQACYNPAYTQGYNDGYNSGYNDSNGYPLGYNDGYAQGQSDAQSACPTGSTGSSGTGAAVRANFSPASIMKASSAKILSARVRTMAVGSVVTHRSEVAGKPTLSIPLAMRTWLSFDWPTWAKGKQVQTTLATPAKPETLNERDSKSGAVKTGYGPTKAQLAIGANIRTQNGPQLRSAARLKNQVQQSVVRALNGFSQ
jgi:flagellar biosynthesis/type III secretory pathway protein FliH